MRVEEVMSADVVGIGPDEPADTAWSRMKSERIRHLVVIDQGRLVGVLSQRDLGGPRGAGTRTGKLVRDLMMSRPAVAKPKTTLRQAANLMHDRLIGSLPVVDDGKVVGIITATDVLEELGRGSSRSPNRAPLADRVARAEKRIAGRTMAAETPAHIRAVGVSISDEDRDYLRRKLGRKLGKFAPAIERVSVRIQDINGPRGGVDKRCRIKVVLSGLPSVVVEERHVSLQAAMDGALARAERAVRQATQRRRTRQGARVA